MAKVGDIVRVKHWKDFPGDYSDAEDYRNIEPGFVSYMVTASAKGAVGVISYIEEDGVCDQVIEIDFLESEDSVSDGYYWDINWVNIVDGYSKGRCDEFGFE